MPKPQHQVNTQTKVIDTTHGRILCIADIRGRLSGLNELAREANAKAIIHTGDFGFFEASSLERINDRTLRHLTMYSPLIASAQRTHLLAAENPPSLIRSTINISMLSEFPLLLAGQIKLQVPVFTVWGACEDVLVLEKFRLGTYSIENLHLLDEATTRCLDIGGVKLRLLGLGGALVPHKMFDNGDGNATIAGGQGTMWTTALQLGELVDTAQRVFDQTETRLLVTHASPGREGIISQLALVLKADLTISAGLHFRYASSYNEFSVQGDFEGFRHKLTVGKDGFDKVWESVKTQVDAVIDDNQRVLLDKALSVVERLPPSQPSTGPGATATGEEPAWKNCWNWNLCDAAFGSLILDIKEGRVSAELKSQGFNYAYRRTATVNATPSSATSPLPPTQGNVSANTSLPPTKGPTPAPDRPVPPHFSGNAGKSATSTPPPRANGTADKADGKNKKKDKKDNRKDRPENRNSIGGASTPDGQKGHEPSTPTIEGIKAEDDVKSPEGSTGHRTPKGGKPPRHPWTIFMRMQLQSVTEEEIREFYGDSASGITRINLLPSLPGRAKVAYIEFGDEEALKAGLNKSGEKFKDIMPEVKRAQDREARNDTSYRGVGGRGRGRGGGGYAARGFLAAGLARGHGQRNSTEGGGENSKGGGDA